MSWTGLAKLRKRRAAFILALDPYVGGLGVVLRTAFLFEVQTTPRYPQCITVLFFEGCHRSWTRNIPNHIERLMKLPSVESVPVKSPRFRWWDEYKRYVWSCLDEALYEKARLGRSRLASESINALIRCHRLLWLFMHSFHCHSMCVTGSRRATSKMCWHIVTQSQYFINNFLVCLPRFFRNRNWVAISSYGAFATVSRRCDTVIATAINPRHSIWYSIHVVMPSETLKFLPIPDFVLDVLKWRSIVRWVTKFPPVPWVPVSCLDGRQVSQNLLVPLVTVAWSTETICTITIHWKSVVPIWFQGWFSLHASLSTRTLHSLS